MNQQVVIAERQRIQAEYERRSREVRAELYSPWQPAELFARSERRRVATRTLVELGVQLTPGDRCLEIGFGTLGWLPDLLAWGVKESNLSGIELDATRARRAQEALPVADLRVGDATDLPWEANTFQLVVASTVFSSVLNAEVRRQIASEVTRVLRPGGALLWYDMAVRNPWNTNVRPIGRRELGALFPALGGRMRSVTLAPVISRRIVGRSHVAATLLEAVPALRTHLLAVLTKPDR